MHPSQPPSATFTPQIHRPSSSGRDDIRRILDLPVLDRPHESLVDQVMQVAVKRTAPANPDGTPFRLRLEQAWAIAAYLQYGGFLAPIDVGGGKTLISLLIPHFAQSRGHQKVMLLVPAPLVRQLTKTDIAWAQQRVHMAYRWFSLSGKSQAARRAITTANRPGLYIVPYSLLSTEDGLETLRNIQPTLVIADEAHTLANESARSKRFWGVMAETAKHHPFEFCALSGTMLRKGLRDLWQLARTALGPHAPVPLHRQNVEEWDAEIGQQASGRLRNPNLSYLTDWAREKYPNETWQYDLSGQRTAFQRRFLSAPGVISSDAASTTAELVIEPVELPKAAAGPVLEGFVELLLLAGMKPNGELVPTPMHIWHTANELASGFYNEPYWPAPEELPGDRFKNEEIIERSKKHHEAKQLFNAACFAWTRNAPLGFDSLRDVANRILRDDIDGIPADVVHLYRNMHALQEGGVIQRPTRPVWFNDYKLRRVVEEVKKRLPEVTPVWAHHKAVHDRLAQLLAAEGIPYEMVRPGHADTTNLLDPSKMDRIYLLSEKRCSEGLNLQHYHTTIYAQVCRSGARFHQMLGRTHRQGQRSKRVSNVVVLTEGTDHETLGACLVEAVDIHQRLGMQHKAVIAAWNPAPSLPPFEMLRAKVPDLASVDPASASAYMAQFGIGAK